MLDSASGITTSRVCPNKSEDLSISEKIWVADTLNNFMASLNTGAPPLEDAQEDVSLVIQVEPMQAEPARVHSVGARGKELVIEPIHGLDPSRSSLGILLGDGLERLLLWVDSPP